jgi:hypothetical protein
MSLARLLATSIARLYAYAMAPDDHTEQERREIIDQADTAIEVANAAAWFDDHLRASDPQAEFGVMEAIMEAKRIANQPTSQHHGLDSMTFPHLAKALDLSKPEDCSQPEVDDRNDERKNHDEGTTP